MPLFYFHVVTVYGILRHQGVDIGVRDYLSHIGDAIHPADAPAKKPAARAERRR